MNKEEILSTLKDTAKNLGGYNLEAIFTVAQLNAGMEFIDRLINGIQMLLPESTASKLDEGALRSVLGVVIAEVVAIVAESGKSFVKKDQHKFVDVVVNSACLAAAQSGINAIDLRGLLEKVISSSFISNVDAAVDIANGKAPTTMVVPYQVVNSKPQQANGNMNSSTNPNRNSRKSNRNR